MQDIQWHIGCSGFHYKEWKEYFYPKGVPASRWFEYYATQFNTLELNTSFYRFPTLAALQAWHRKAPEGFSFSAKMPRSITHFKKFEDTERMVNDFYTVLRAGLQEKIECVLIQLPPQLQYSEEKLAKIIRQADPTFKNVIEFRHESWWRDDVKALLGQHHISFCGVSFPKIQHDQVVVNAELVYYRFHGVPQLFYSSYDPSFIESVYRQIHDHPGVREAFVYFNNTASPAAVENARLLQALLTVS